MVRPIFAAWARAMVVLVALHATAFADTPPAIDGLELAQRLGAASRDEVARAVEAIERAPANTPYLDEALREAGRACEDVLADPARALAIYERIIKEFPDGSASRVARVRAPLLRSQIGSGHAKEAAELAQLVTMADTLDPEDVIRRADALAVADWPGAVDAALFVAEWLQRVGRLGEAAQRFAVVEAKWPGSPQAFAARRGAATTAIMAHDWKRARQIAETLPAIDDADRVLRDELFEKIARGQRFDFWYRVAWILLAICVAGLLGSLLEAARRGNLRAVVRRPPIEVLFLVPIGGVLVGVALTTHQAIAPAVLVLSLGGIVLAWISGVTLELLRQQRRPIGVRGSVHVALCLVAVAALLYIVLAHDNLLDMMIETVRFGPDP